MIGSIVMMVMGYFVAQNADGLLARLGGITFVLGVIGVAWFVIGILIAIIPQVFGRK